MVPRAVCCVRNATLLCCVPSGKPTVFVMPLCAVCQHTQEQLLPGCGEGLHGSNNGGCQHSVALAEMKVATVQKKTVQALRGFLW